MSKGINFDVNEALAALRAGKDLNGKDGILTPLIKSQERFHTQDR